MASLLMRQNNPMAHITLNRNPAPRLLALLGALILALSILAPVMGQAASPQIVLTQQPVIQGLASKADEIEKRV
jgi:hypothetical protein